MQLQTALNQLLLMHSLPCTWLHAVDLIELVSLVLCMSLIKPCCSKCIHQARSIKSCSGCSMSTVGSDDGSLLGKLEGGTMVLTEGS